MEKNSTLWVVKEKGEQQGDDEPKVPEGDNQGAEDQLVTNVPHPVT